MNPVFSFIQHTVGLVVGSQCGFVYFLDGAMVPLALLRAVNDTCSPQAMNLSSLSASTSRMLFTRFSCSFVAVLPVLPLLSALLFSLSALIFAVGSCTCTFTYTTSFDFSGFTSVFTPAFLSVGLPQPAMMKITSMLIKKNVPFALCHSIKLLRISAYKNKTNDNVFQFLTIFFLIFMN